MKRLWISCLILLLLAGIAALHLSRLESLTSELIEQLEHVELSLKYSDWSGAKNCVDQIYEQWESQAFYLHTMLRHTDIDAIRSSLREVMAYLDTQEDTAECLAVTARLINQLELLLEAELPTIKNLL